MIGPQTYIALAVAAALAFGGWTARAWYDGNQRRVALEAAQAAADRFAQRESAVATAVEARLADLQANQTIIDRGVIREVQNPVYRNVCLPADAIRLLNAAAAGSRPDPVQPTGQLPGKAGAAN